MVKNPRSGRRYMRALADLKARGEVQACWRQASPRCGRTLYASAPKGHRQSITLGHIVAYEDRPDLFWDPTNHAPECPACNYGDGARRTNRKRRLTEAMQRRHEVYTNPNW